MGRFISVDPLMASGAPGNPKSWNRYVYASNNPLRLIDPTGLFSQDPKQDPPPNIGTFTVDVGPGASSWVWKGTGAEQKINWNDPSWNDPKLAGVRDASSRAQQQQDGRDFMIGVGKSLQNKPYEAAHFVTWQYLSNKGGFIVANQIWGPSIQGPANPAQAVGMITTELTLGYATGRGTAAIATKANIFSGVATSSLSTMEGAYASAGTIRTIAGYEVAGTFGRVGNSYNVSIWGLYGTRTGPTGKIVGDGFLAFTQTLSAEAQAAGATRLNILGTHIINEGFLNPRIMNRAAQRQGFSFRQVNSESVFLSKPLP